MNQKITNIVLTKELHEILNTLSKEHDVSISSLVRMAVGFVYGAGASPEMKEIVEIAFAKMKRGEWK